MLSFLERLVKPFPLEEPTQPPGTLLAFCRHYTRGLEPYLSSMSLLTALIAIAEVSMFGFRAVADWLVHKQPDSLLADEGGRLLVMTLLMLVGLPLLVLVHSMLLHQTLLGNYPMVIRWQAHRYLLRQSVSFYSNDFAGRVATKVMQTALAVREAVMKTLGVLVYVLVYFISMVVMVGQADWRLMLPMLIWLVIYMAIQYYFVPKLKKVAAEQAEARPLMRGGLWTVTPISRR